MAVTEYSHVNDVTSGFLNKLRGEGDGPGGTPQGDRTGVLAGLMSEHTQIKTGTFAGTALAVEVDLGISVQYLQLWNANNSMQLQKTRSLLKDEVIKTVIAGDLTFTDARVRFAKEDDTPLQGFTILVSADNPDTHVWHYMAFGV